MVSSIATDQLTWQTGHIQPWWHLEHHDLEYQHEPFNNSHDQTRWRTLGFTQTRFTGDMYDMRRVEPEWIMPFREIITMPLFSWSIYRMRPGDVIPEHGDTYQRFCELHGIHDINSIKRYIVFLEPWQSGHYFEIDGTAIVNWHAGTWVQWHGNTRHLAANLGQVPRYTLQITGVKEGT